MYAKSRDRTAVNVWYIDFKMCGSGAVTAYGVFRMFVSVLDTVTDGLHSYILYRGDHVHLCLLTIGFMLLPWIVTIINALVAKFCNSREKQLEGTMWGLVVTTYAEIFEPFFESGPELILQLVFLLKAVHMEEFKIFSYWGLLLLVSMALSFLSLVTSCLRYSQEAVSCSWRFMGFTWTTVSNLVFRSLAATALFFLHPQFACVVVICLYFINFVAYSCFGESVLDNLVHSYYGLWAPVGYAQDKGQVMGYLGEKDTGSIQGRKLPRKILLFHILHLLTNLLLVVPLVLLATWFPAPSVPLLVHLAPQVLVEYLLVGAPVLALLATAPVLVFLMVVARQAKREGLVALGKPGTEW